MKIFMAIVTLVFCLHHLNGQTPVMNHLFKDKANEYCLFINPAFQLSEIALQYSAISAICAGVIINKKIVAGALYNFTLNDLPIPESQGSGMLQMKMGGIRFEYTLWPKEKVHLTIPLSIGVGRLKIIENTTRLLEGNPSFSFAEPGLMLEINILKYAKLGIGTSYRYMSHLYYNSLTANDLKGFNAVASVKFGMFNHSESE